MKDLCIATYCFYKNKYANTVLLFHVGNMFEAYNEDVIQLQKVLSKPYTSLINTQLSLSFSENELERVVQLLIQNSIPVHIIEYRDNNGKFVLPKVNQILKDQEDDY